MKRLILLGLIAAAISSPALFFPDHAANPALQPAATDGAQAWGQFAGGGPTVVSPEAGSPLPEASPFLLASTGRHALTNGAPLVNTQPPVYSSFGSPAEWLNFSVTPDWVRRQWPRVSVVAGEDELTGLRVALVSGPRPADVHGSLTYYFDGNQRARRIAFRGWTGDPSELLQWVTNQFGLSPPDSGNLRLYEKRSWGKTTGALRIDLPPVIDRHAPNEQFMVLMEIVDPSSWLAISEQNRLIFDAMSAR